MACAPHKVKLFTKVLSKVAYGLGVEITRSHSLGVSKLLTRLLSRSSRGSLALMTVISSFRLLMNPH